MKHLGLALYLVLVSFSPALAVENDLTTVQVDPTPTQVALIGVVKSKREMLLLDKYDNIIKSYRIALGPAPVGKKESEGDGKTPEGVYKIDMHNPNSEYYKSLRISYPNTTDLETAKKLGVSPGGQIFIHGEPLDRNWKFWHYNNRNDWTQGCIAMSNRDIDEVWSLVQDGTPIVIKP